MNCERVKQELLFGDVSAPESENEIIGKHLKHCEACRQWHEQNREMLASISQYQSKSDDEPDPIFLEKLADAVAIEAQLHSGAGPEVKKINTIYYWVAAAVALFVILPFSYIMLTGEGDGEQLTETAAGPDSEFHTFLERSERFLLLLDETEEQFEAGYRVSFTAQSELADELRRDLADLKAYIDDDEFQRLSEVMNHLHHIYREAAVLSEKPAQQEIEVIRNAVDQHALISRVRLLKMASEPEV